MIKKNYGLPYIVAIIAIAVIIILLLVPKSCQYQPKVDYIDRIIEKIDTVTMQSVVEKYIVKKGRTVYPPPDTIVVNDTVYIKTAPFTALMDTTLTSVTKSDSGDVITIVDTYKIEYQYPSDMFKVKNKQTVDFQRVNKEIVKIVKQELHWYNKPEYTIPIGFLVGTVGSVYIISSGGE